MPPGRGSTAAHSRNQDSCSTSSASAAEPSISYATVNSRARWATNGSSVMPSTRHRTPPGPARPADLARSREKPCDSIPSAALLRVARLAKAMNTVSSIIAAGPSRSSRRADSASVTIRRRVRHGSSVLQHVPLQRREHLRLPPTRHLARFHHVQVLVLRLEVADVQAPTAANLCRDGHGARTTCASSHPTYRLRPRTCWPWHWGYATSPRLVRARHRAA